jgi:hypothetical protein
VAPLSARPSSLLYLTSTPLAFNPSFDTRRDRHTWYCIDSTGKASGAPDPLVVSADNWIEAGATKDLEAAQGQFIEASAFRVS